MKQQSLFKITIFFIIIINSQCFLDYSQQHTLSCQNIPANTNLTDSLPLLWPVTILHQIDRITFLIVCPLLFLAQMTILFTYYKFPSLFNKPGDIFFGILISQIGLNLHLFATSIYYQVNSVYESMPSSFVSFCTTMSILQSFLFVLQISYMFFFLIWVMYTVKTSLKQRKFLLGIGVHLLIFIIAIGLTIIFWFDQFLGLNNQGLCAITAVRKKQASIALPVIGIVASISFIVLGTYSWVYFKRNMPKVEGLQRRRYSQNKLISLYIGGVSIFLTLYAIIGLIMYINCFLDTPQPLLTVWASVQSLLILAQYCFFVGLVLKNQLYRKKIKKALRGICKKQIDWSQQIEMSLHFEQTNMGQFGLNQKILQLKDQQKVIDLMKVAQIISVLAGIFVSHTEYMKNFDFQKKQQDQIKRIYYNETINFDLGPQIFSDFKIETQILPKIGILDGTMTIHAPRIFKRLIKSDGLQNIDKSFDLFQNYQKIYDLVEGQGGKSGEFFFFSSDNKYVLKTINTQQYHFILQNLQRFTEYFQKNPHSLLAKIYGVYSIKGNQLQHIYHMILMKNILGCQKSQIIRTYDMKGSKHDRQVIKTNKKYKYNQLSKLTLKDTDFIKLQGKLNIPDAMIRQFRNILRKDTTFLKSLNLIDYSLLVVRINWGSGQQKTQKNKQITQEKQQAEKVMQLEQKQKSIQQNYDIIPRQRKRQLSSLSSYHQKHKSILFTSFHKFQQIQSTQNSDQYYHIGVIDYMQKWDLQKKSQKWWKTLIGKKQVSAQSPNKYQKRFMSFVDQITYSNRISDVSYSSSKTESKSNQSGISSNSSSKPIADLQGIEQNQQQEVDQIK